MNEKMFLNCYGKSPAVMKDHYDSEVDLVLENGAQWESIHSAMAAAAKVKERSIVDEAGKREKVESSSGGHFWNLVAVFTVVAAIGFVGYLVYKDECKFHTRYNLFV